MTDKVKVYITNFLKVRQATATAIGVLLDILKEREYELLYRNDKSVIEKHRRVLNTLHNVIEESSNVDYRLDFTSTLHFDIDGERYYFPRRINSPYSELEYKNLTHIVSILANGSRYENQVKIYTFGHFYNAGKSEQWVEWFSLERFHNWDCDYELPVPKKPEEKTELKVKDRDPIICDSTESISRISNALDAVKLSLNLNNDNDKRIASQVAEIQNIIENQLTDDIRHIALNLTDEQYVKFAKDINKAFGEKVLDPYYRTT